MKFKFEGDTNVHGVVPPSVHRTITYLSKMKTGSLISTAGLILALGYRSTGYFSQCIMMYHSLFNLFRIKEPHTNKFWWGNKKTIVAWKKANKKDIG